MTNNPRDPYEFNDPVFGRVPSANYSAITHFRFNIFIGSKVAHEVMVGLELTETDSEAEEATLEAAMSTVVARGIMLGERGQTVTEEEAKRIRDTLPIELLSKVSEHIPLLINLGVSFHIEEARAVTPKFLSWSEEFKLLMASEAE